jgi:hypothetical protein
MKAEIVRFSDLLMKTCSPPMTPEVILLASNLPADAKVVHMISVKIDNLDFCEVLISSDSYPDRSISELAQSAGISLVYEGDVLRELREAS